LLPSTEARDLPLRRSQRTRIVRVWLDEAAATGDASSLGAERPDGAVTGERPSPLHAAVVAARPAAAQKRIAVFTFMPIASVCRVRQHGSVARNRFLSPANVD